MSIVLRNKTYWLKRRVPKQYARVESRTVVWCSLKTDDPDVAKVKHKEVWNQFTTAWESLKQGEEGIAEERFLAAKELAKAKGIKFLDPQKVTRLPIEDILDRVELAEGTKNVSVGTRAYLGAIDPPPITITKAQELFFDLAVDDTKGKTADQIRRWQNPKKKAFKNLIGLIGDKDIFEIDRDDMIDFYQWWRERIENEGLSPNSANKDMGAIQSALKRLRKHYQWKHEFPIGDLSIRDEGGSSRGTYSDEFIQDMILRNGALDGLNDEARIILLLIINTGARPSEIAGLLSKHINLSHNIPHIMIRAEGRKLKTTRSSRDIPLLGVSLDAVRELELQDEKAFPRYFGKDAISAVLNKYLKENGLKESPAHTVYSLRHAFEDRMLRAGIDQRIRADILGHDFDRPNYGEGGGLVHKQSVLRAVVFPHLPGT